MDRKRLRSFEGAESIGVGATRMTPARRLGLWIRLGITFSGTLAFGVVACSNSNSPADGGPSGEGPADATSDASEGGTDAGGDSVTPGTDATADAGDDVEVSRYDASGPEASSPDAGTCGLNPMQTSWNGSSDFSTVQNPCGVWSYGHTTTLGSPFILNTQLGYWANSSACPVPDSPGWYEITAAGDPITIVQNDGGTATESGGASVGRNESANTSCLTDPPGQLWIHPGPTGEYSVARWTAPAAGTYTFDVSFAIGDQVQGGGPKDAAVLHSGSLIFEHATNTSPTFSTTLTVAAGDTFDVAVGLANGETWDDGTTPVTIVVGPSSGDAGGFSDAATADALAE